MLPYDRNLKQRSREFRKNMTEGELVLWSKIRLEQLKGYRFNRQKIVGGYIVDFYCAKAKLTIEVDGSQHYSSDMINSDKDRDDYLVGLGLRVLRFTNVEVLKNIDGVIESILEQMET